MTEIAIPTSSSVPTANGTNGHGPVTLLIVGAGQRGQIYANYCLQNPDQAKVVAIAEPRPHRRKVACRAHKVSPELQFSDWNEVVAKGKVADAVVIGVLDALHAPLVSAFSKQGYHILCEKPMATSISDCVKMVQQVQSAKEPFVFGIGHVLRYSPYNQAVKAVIDSGALGEIVNIQHIEPVGNQHFAHSFVRGNWGKEANTSFSLMTKSCHDIDILSFYLSGLKPTKVHSFGSLHLFKPAKKPVEARGATRCYECPLINECAWSAKKIYVDPLSGTEDKERWAQHVVDVDVIDIENVTEALKDGPYGVCIYEAGNDVVDHQVVNVEYEGGVTASMTMSAFTEAICDRGTRIQGTKGELIGDMVEFSVFDFATRQKTLHTPPSDGGGHGGGDTGLARAFVKAVATNDQTVLGVTPDQVLDSHLLVFAAEQSRKESSVVDFASFKRAALSV